MAPNWGGRDTLLVVMTSALTERSSDATFRNRLTDNYISGGSLVTNSVFLLIASPLITLLSHCQLDWIFPVIRPSPSLSAPLTLVHKFIPLVREINIRMRCVLCHSYRLSRFVPPFSEIFHLSDLRPTNRLLRPLTFFTRTDPSLLTLCL